MDNKNSEITESGIFHIHFDGKTMSSSLYEVITKEYHFIDSDFAGSPEGYKTFYPDKHLTLKLKTKEEFINVWSDLEKITDNTNFNGYIEGEYIPLDIAVDYKKYKDNIAFPFTVKTRGLNGKKKEEFRQTEIHLVMDKKRSDPRLIKKLLESGMFPAEIDKGNRGYFMIFTAQGYIKDIHVIIQETLSYLAQAGGAVNCTLKEERAIKHKLYGIGISDLPEIVDKVKFHKKEWEI